MALELCALVLVAVVLAWALPWLAASWCDVCWRPAFRVGDARRRRRR